MIGMLVFGNKVFSQIDVSITASIAPPPLPVYDQPECPVDGYIWTPGYWAYGDDGYYWVPGVWVDPPQPGYLWTPCYWGFIGGVYGWNHGYWGTTVGFYGGVNYGYGYGGTGFGGGRWERGHFRYNTAVMNVNRRVIHHTYIDRTVINNRTSRTSFNGGEHGTHARPSFREQSAMKESHLAPTGVQFNHEQSVGKDKSQFATENHGHPATTSMNGIGGSKFGQKGHTPSAVSDAPHQQAASPTHVPAANNGVQPQGHISNVNPAPHQSIPNNQPNRTNHSQPQPQPHATLPQPHSLPQPQHVLPQPQQQQQHVPQQRNVPQQQHQMPQTQQHNAPQQHAPAQQQAPRAAGGGEHRPR